MKTYNLSKIIIYFTYLLCTYEGIIPERQNLVQAAGIANMAVTVTDKVQSL